MLTKPVLCQRGQKWFSTCVEQTPIKCQPGDTMYLNLGGPNPENASEDTKCTLNMCWPKSIRCQRGHKLHLNMFQQNSTYSSKDIKLYLKPARTQKVSQHVLTKSLPCLRVHKMQLNMCWPNLSYASKDKIHLDICWPNTSMPARTEDGSHHVDYIPFHAS